ncbi:MULTISPECIES: oxidoreductase [unclassified Janthinobacterium]|uniref:oxidoreductase n=1 Tax=unclassified Janthinobacterium TaxID=2610881 RepID=UPI00161A8769|nr:MULTISPECIES: oxidoreductase [unclassified Janthinobacterium]MBB5609853.1 NAD(P)-dependent dehydrogenase (short-subunit alcohol dehydrogenase family) [Janthinobacterium sp. S3T4]MBB5615119.1 NAD(P)-dependent dehydrogenase (short-subunit alcohol dehydrogenase family) [Janthinobacterium sp. S3M3]
MQKQHNDGSRTWLITGVSSGLGLAFARAALAAGHTVIGTVRQDSDGAQFEKLGAGRAHALLLDISDLAAIGPALAQAEQALGPIDVLVNNAGYGHEGTLEESPLEELQHQFAVNVYGPVAMIKAVLPQMRQRRSGCIVNVTSMAGLAALPGIAYYSGSKFALEGISASLAQEVAPFGIRVIALAPGSFRTDWAGRSMVRTQRQISDYDDLFEPIRNARKAKSGIQAGDPEKAAQVLLAIVAAEQAPRQLLLGSDALTLVRARIKALSAELDQWEALTQATDYLPPADQI